MERELETINIQNKIFSIRNKQVMIDRGLAELYRVETKRINEQVKRNIERFPEEFMFQLTQEEQKGLEQNLRSQNATSSWGGNRKLSYAFTEQGVAMLSAVLKSETAIQMSIRIMDAFVKMRHLLQTNATIFSELNFIKQHLLESDLHQKETDKKIDELFSLMDKYKIEDKQGIFFQGQIFDAYAKFESFIKQAKKEIILIDNYVDLSILDRFTKKNKNVAVTIYTSPLTKLTTQDIQKFNAQYPTLIIRHTKKSS